MPGLRRRQRRGVGLVDQGNFQGLPGTRGSGLQGDGKTLAVVGEALQEKASHRVDGVGPEGNSEGLARSREQLPQGKDAQVLPRYRDRAILGPNVS